MPTIRKRGNSHQAQVRIKSQGKIVYEESASFPTEATARAWGTALEKRIKKLGVAGYLNQKTSLADIVLQWVAQKEAIKPLSNGMRHSITELLRTPFSDKAMDDITAQDISRWILDKSKTLAPATCMHHLMVMRSVYKTAPSLADIHPDLLPLTTAMDSLRRLKVIAKSDSRERRISDAELDQIVTHLKGKFLLVPTDIFVRLAIALPRRREELLTMKWADYTGTTVILRDTKNPTKPRTEVIPVPPVAQAIINKLERTDERMMPYKPESVSAAFQRAVRAVGLADIRLHDLRHEGISRLFEQGLAIQEVALISGHVSWAALRRYTHIKPESVLEKLRKHHEKSN